MYFPKKNASLQDADNKAVADKQKYTAMAFGFHAGVIRISCRCIFLFMPMAGEFLRQLGFRCEKNIQ